MNATEAKAAQVVAMLQSLKSTSFGLKNKSQPICGSASLPKLLGPCSVEEGQDP